MFGSRKFKEADAQFLCSGHVENLLSISYLTLFIWDIRCMCAYSDHGSQEDPCKVWSDRILGLFGTTSELEERSVSC